MADTVPSLVSGIVIYFLVRPHATPKGVYCDIKAQNSFTFIFHDREDLKAFRERLIKGISSCNQERYPYV